MLNAQKYKAAIELNNRGVCLLDLQCYREAVDTFNHAFSLLRASATSARNAAVGSSSSPNIVSPPPPSAMGPEMINTVLALTMKQLIEGKVSKSSKQKCDEYFHFTIVTDDKTVNRAMVEAAHSSPSNHDVYSIRIDDMDGQCDLEEANFHMESAIILFNLATACRGYASIALQKNNRSRSEKLLSRSRLLYQLVLKVLNEGETKKVSEMARFLLVSMMALQGLMQLSLALHCIAEGTQYYIKLGEFRSEFSDLDIHFFSLEAESIQPAAARAA